MTAEQRVALVTGASRGIGRAIAEELAAAGYAVVVNHRDSQKDAEAVAAAVERHTRGLVVAADVADGDAVRAMADQVRRTFGRLDVLVNNAGTVLPGDWRTLETETWRRCLEVNLTGVFHCIQAFGDSVTASGHGRVINIGSTYAGIGAGEIAAYSAAKAGVASLTRSFAKELAPHATVNLIAPGNIDTDMTAAAGPEFVQEVVTRTPLRRLGRPEEIAGLTRYLVSEDAAFITGQSFVADGGHSLR